MREKVQNFFVYWTASYLGDVQTESTDPADQRIRAETRALTMACRFMPQEAIIKHITQFEEVVANDPGGLWDWIADTLSGPDAGIDDRLNTCFATIDRDRAIQSLVDTIGVWGDHDVVFVNPDAQDDPIDASRTARQKAGMARAAAARAMSSREISQAMVSTHSGVQRLSRMFARIRRAGHEEMGAFSLRLEPKTDPDVKMQDAPADPAGAPRAKARWRGEGGEARAKQRFVRSVVLGGAFRSQAAGDGKEEEGSASVGRDQGGAGDQDGRRDGDSDWHCQGDKGEEGRAKQRFVRSVVLFGRPYPHG